MLCFVLFKYTAPTVIYTYGPTLSLLDALPSTAGSVQDQVFAFTRLANLDTVLPAAVLAQLVWNSAILTGSGAAYQMAASNIQISMDLLMGGTGTDEIGRAHV